MINGAGPGFPDLQRPPTPPRNRVENAAPRAANPDSPLQDARPGRVGPAAVGAIQARARVLFAAAGEFPNLANGLAQGPLPRPAMPALPFPLPAQIAARGPVGGRPQAGGPGLFDFAVVRMPPRHQAAAAPAARAWLPDDPFDGASDDDTDQSGSTQTSSESAQTGLNSRLRARLLSDLEDTASSGAIR